MRALITGGAGFIGSYLAEELAARGCEVSIWDNLFRGKYENIAHLIHNSNYFYELDLAQEETTARMTELLLKERPAYIFHYAAINGTQYFYDIPAKVLEVNTNATYHLMQAVRRTFFAADQRNRRHLCSNIPYPRQLCRRQADRRVLCQAAGGRGRHGLDHPAPV